MSCPPVEAIELLIVQLRPAIDERLSDDSGQTAWDSVFRIFGDDIRRGFNRARARMNFRQTPDEHRDTDSDLMVGFMECLQRNPTANARNANPILARERMHLETRVYLFAIAEAGTDPTCEELTRQLHRAMYNQALFFALDYVYRYFRRRDSNVVIVINTEIIEEVEFEDKQNTHASAERREAMLRTLDLMVGCILSLPPMQKAVFVTVEFPALWDSEQFRQSVDGCFSDWVGIVNFEDCDTGFDSEMTKTARLLEMLLKMKDGLREDAHRLPSTKAASILGCTPNALDQNYRRSLRGIRNCLELRTAH